MYSHSSMPGQEPSMDKVRLFDQEDSGLGSMNFSSINHSIDLGGRPQDDLHSHDEIAFDHKNIRTGSSHHDDHHNIRHNCAKITNQPTTQLLSLASDLGNLNIGSSQSSTLDSFSNRTSDGLRCLDSALLAESEWCDSGLDSELFSSINASGTGIDNCNSNSCQDKNVHEDTSLDNQQCHESLLSPEQRVALYEGDIDGDNCLHLSIINRRLDLALEVIRQAPDYVWISFPNNLRQTALHLAVLTGQSSLVRRLVCAGALVDAQDMQGNTALHAACRVGLDSAVKHLLTPVQYHETKDNSWDIPFQRLPQDLNATNFDGETALHVAITNGHEGIVRLLLEAGANPNFGHTKSGRTSLHLAVEWAGPTLVRMLAHRQGVDLTQRDYAGLTAAQLAYSRGQEHIAHLLHAGDLDLLSGDESDSTLVDSDSDLDSMDDGMQ